MQLYYCKVFADLRLLPRTLTDLHFVVVKFPLDATIKLCEFLVNSNVSNLLIRCVDGLNGAQLAEAIVKCAGRIKLLTWDRGDFSQTAALQLFQVMQVSGNVLDEMDIHALPGDWFVEALIVALTHENCRLRTLHLWLSWLCIGDDPTRLLQAFNGKRCSLLSLRLCNISNPVTNEQIMLQRVERKLNQVFKYRYVMLVVLSGQQVKRLSVHCSLHRLPVEMFRLVKEMLS